MGAKTGFAHAVLWAMGLRRGQGADAVLLNDAGPWAHVWAVLANPERCGEVAAILRGWADEDPRQLWERLREEHRGEWDGWTAERAAGWLTAGAWAYRQGYPESGFAKDRAYATPATDTHHSGDGLPTTKIASGIESVAAWLQLKASNRLINAEFDENGEWRNTGQGGTTFGGAEFCTPAGETADKVEPVAAWLQTGAWSYEQGNNKTGFCGPGDRRQDTTATATATAKAGRAATAVSSGISIYAGTAADIEPPPDCEGVFVFMDPPYLNTTGYAADLPRKDVLAIASKWSEAGAVVCVSEAEPLDLPGWHHVEITSARTGQKRTFSKQQAEWLTMNREPEWKPAIQEGLFG